MFGNGTAPEGTENTIHDTHGNRQLGITRRMEHGRLLFGMLPK